MPLLTLIWAALGLLTGAIAWLAGARSAFPRGGGRWGAFARWWLPPAAAALAAIMGGWLADMMVDRLAATPTALGAAAIVSLLISLLSRRGVALKDQLTQDTPASR